jgi:hypothetical protein
VFGRSEDWGLGYMDGPGLWEDEAT